MAEMQCARRSAMSGTYLKLQRNEAKTSAASNCFPSVNGCLKWSAKCNFIRFYPLDASYAVLAVVVCPSVRLSVCLSQVGVILKRLNVGSRKQRHTIAHGRSSFLTPKISAKLTRGHPSGGIKCRRG